MSDIREFLELYQDDPVGFVENCLDIDLDEWQREFLECLPHHRKISIASGHGTGKSTVVCFAILWHILFKFPQKTVVTAPSSSQLYSALWADLKRWIEALPEVLRDTIEYTSDVVRLKEAPNESFIRASVARLDQPDALQGVHSENVLLCVDESAGVPLSVFVLPLSFFNLASLISYFLTASSSEKPCFFAIALYSFSEMLLLAISALLCIPPLLAFLKAALVSLPLGAVLEP